MKLLQCPRCKRPAIGPSTRHHPDGEPLVIGRIPIGQVSFKCNRCKQTTRVKSTEIAALPELSTYDLNELGFSYLTARATVDSDQGEPLG